MSSRLLFVFNGLVLLSHAYVVGQQQRLNLTTTARSVYGDIRDSSAEAWLRIKDVYEEHRELFKDALVDYKALGGNAAMAADSMAAKRVLPYGTLHEAAVLLDLDNHEDDPYRGFFYPGHADARTPDNCYIVKVGEGAELERLERLLKAAGSEVKGSFSIGGGGYTVCFEAGQVPLAFLNSLRWIEHVERDQRVRASQVQRGAPWGLAALGEVPGAFAFERTGKGVTLYIIDSGIATGHPEFSGRAKIGFSTLANGKEDCSGHGSEVASVAAGLNVGVAKEAEIVVAAVLDCAGEGTNSDLVAAIDWVARHFSPPGVVNMSVGGPKSPSVDAAIAAAIARGIPVVVAAGNSGVDACSQSPSCVQPAMVVGAATPHQRMAPFSNHGPCVDLFAPGTDILVAAANEPGGDRYYYAAGTSLAAPFVVGIMALLLEEDPGLSVNALMGKVLALAKTDYMKGPLIGTPNLFAQAPKPSAIPGDTIVTLVPPASMPASMSWQSLGLILGLVALVIVTVTVVALLLFWFRRRRQRAAAAASEATLIIPAYEFK